MEHHRTEVIHLNKFKDTSKKDFEDRTTKYYAVTSFTTGFLKPIFQKISWIFRIRFHSANFSVLRLRFLLVRVIDSSGSPFPTLCALFVNSMLIILAFLLFILQFSVLPFFGHPSDGLFFMLTVLFSEWSVTKMQKVEFSGLLLCLLTWTERTEKWFVVLSCVPCRVSVTQTLPSRKYFYVKPSQHGRTKIPLKPHRLPRAVRWMFKDRFLLDNSNK